MASPMINGNHVAVLHFRGHLPECLLKPQQKQPYFCITWFIKGQGHYTIDFNTYPIRDNSIFSIQPHTIHYINTRCQEAAEGWMLLIHWDYFQQHGSNIIPFLCENRNVVKSSMLPEAGQELITLQQLLRRALKQGIPGQEPIINAYLTIILAGYKKQLEQPGENKHPDARYDLFMTLLNNEFKNIRHVEDYAAKVNLSSRQLNRICKDATGLSAGQLIHMRLQLEAKRLLFYTDHPVKEISWELGFEEPSYFIKFFKRYEEVTPQQFRINQQI